MKPQNQRESWRAVEKCWGFKGCRGALRELRRSALTHHLLWTSGYSMIFHIAARPAPFSLRQIWWKSTPLTHTCGEKLGNSPLWAPITVANSSPALVPPPFCCADEPQARMAAAMRDLVPFFCCQNESKSTDPPQGYGEMLGNWGVFGRSPAPCKCT